MGSGVRPGSRSCQPCGGQRRAPSARRACAPALPPGSGFALPALLPHISELYRVKEGLDATSAPHISELDREGDVGCYVTTAHLGAV
eukprot:248777-Rhodomonas_salina.1